MTDTCQNKASKSRGIRSSWGFFKKESLAKRSARTQSQSFYDAFTAFLSTSCTIALEKDDVNEGLCPNPKLRKLELEDDKINVIRQSTANTGCDEEKLGRVNYSLENCASAEEFVANFFRTGDRPRIEKKCSEPTVSLSLADSNISHDCSTCKSCRNRYPTLCSETGHRNLRSFDSYNKWSQKERKSQDCTSKVQKRWLSKKGVSCDEELSCDGKEFVDHSSISSPSHQVQKLSCEDVSRSYNSANRFLKPKNVKTSTNVDVKSVNSEYQLQYKEEYRKKLRSARDSGELPVVSEFCHTEKARQRRLSTLRRRNYVSYNGHDLEYDCMSTCLTQKELCRPVFVLVEKMSKKKIKQLQSEVKDVSKMSAIRKTSELKSACRNYGFTNTSPSIQLNKVSLISEFSETDENDSDSTEIEEVTGTLHSTAMETNFEASSQFCFDGNDIITTEAVKVTGTFPNSNSSQICGISDVGSSQPGISKICETKPLLYSQEVSTEVLSMADATQDLEKNDSCHAQQLVKINPGSVSKHKNAFRPEVEKTCLSRKDDKSNLEQKSLVETNSSGCLHAVSQAVDQHDFKTESDVSKVGNSSGSVNVGESVEPLQVFGVHPLSYAGTSHTTRLRKRLPKPLAKLDVQQDTTVSNAVNSLNHLAVDDSSGVSQAMNKVGVIKDSLDTFNPVLSEPMKMKGRHKLVESKPILSVDILAQCTDNSEFFPKSSSTDKRQKKERFGNLQNNVLAFSTLEAASDHPKDCLNSIMTVSLNSTKARKRKVECHVASKEVSDNQSDDADSYVPNFMTHSQLLDENSLTEKWKEATDLEEWWLNDIGNWTNLSTLSSTISSGTTSEKSMGSEDFRWCAMLADQSEWPELELDVPMRSEESMNGCNRKFSLITDAGHDQALHGEGSNLSELDANGREDTQLLEADGSVERLKYMKQTTCRVGKKKQMLWLKLKEAGSLGTRKVTTTARIETQVANSEITGSFLGPRLSHNMVLALDVMEVDKKHGLVKQIVTTSTAPSEAVKRNSCEENVDSGVPANPAFVGTLSGTSGASASTSIPTSSITSVILASNNVHRSHDARFACSLSDHSFSRTSTVPAYCHAHSEKLYNHTSSLNLKCNATVESICYNQSHFSVAPFGPHHFDSTFYSNSAVVPVSLNLCTSRINFNSFVSPFNNEPSCAYFIPHSQSASRTSFNQNASTASFISSYSDEVTTMSSHGEFSRCQTASSEVKLNSTTNSQGSSQCESKAKGDITSDKTLDLLKVSEATHTNTVKHVIPVRCSTMDNSSLAFDSANTMIKTFDTKSSLHSSSSACRIENDYSAKPQQSMVYNDGYHKPNFVFNDLNNSKIFPTASVCEKEVAADKNIWGHSLPVHRAKSKFESPVLRLGLHMQGRRSQERDEICSKDLIRDLHPGYSYAAGLYKRLSNLDQGLSRDSSEALDVVSENSSQDCSSEVSSRTCTKDVCPPSPLSEDALTYSNCNSDMCSWLAASMGLYTCDCGAAFSDSWSCQQHQSRCSAVIRT